MRAQGRRGSLPPSPAPAAPQAPGGGRLHFKRRCPALCQPQSSEDGAKATAPGVTLTRGSAPWEAPSGPLSPPWTPDGGTFLWWLGGTRRTSETSWAPPFWVKTGPGLPRSRAAFGTWLLPPSPGADPVARSPSCAGLHCPSPPPCCSPPGLGAGGPQTRHPLPPHPRCQRQDPQ